MERTGGRDVRILEVKWFVRFARQHGIEDAALLDAVERAERGLIDAVLGGGVIKQRIARPGGGKSGGFRSVILFRQGERAFFVYGFAKNELENISAQDLQEFRELAREVFAFTDAEINFAVKTGKFRELK